jgi:aminopeptidase N
METAGVNLDWFFDEWVYRAGIPNYEVKYERQSDRVAFVVNQVHKTDELTGYFKMPGVFEVYFKDGSSAQKKVWLSHASDTVYVSAPVGKEIDYTLFDPASNLIKTINFKKTYEELAAQAEKAKHMIDRYDALIALRDFDTDKKRDLLIKIFDKETFHQTKEEVVGQLSKDTNAISLALLKRALNDKDFQVRRAVPENVAEVAESILSDFEKLLTDSSYTTIEVALRKLCKLYPDKTQQYLTVVKNVMGIHNNIRITWLELSSKELSGSNYSANQKQLVNYTSNAYEFRTRTKAMEALERLNYCDEDLIKNLFNACLSANSRLSNPASRILKALLKKQENHDKAKAIFALTTWKDWERKIIEAHLK